MEPARHTRTRRRVLPIHCQPRNADREHHEPFGQIFHRPIPDQLPRCVQHEWVYMKRRGRVGPKQFLSGEYFQLTQQPIGSDTVDRRNALKVRPVKHPPLSIHLLCGMRRGAAILKRHLRNGGGRGERVSKDDRTFRHRGAGSRIILFLDIIVDPNGDIHLVVGGACLGGNRNLHLRPARLQVDPPAGPNRLGFDHLAIRPKQTGDLGHHLQAYS